MTRRAWIGLAVWLAICYGAALIGSQFTANGWYRALDKPSWTPPPWVFGPVWTVLYGMMAVAAWLVWKDRGLAGARTALLLFVVQLALNVAWSWLFFGLHRPGLALIDVVALWAAILATLVAFWKVRWLAGALLLPYLAWVTFAAALNHRIWQLNP